MKKKELPINDITHLIPQKKPFVMVDTLVRFSENFIESTFTILEDNVFVKDQEFLESGLIENMAQTIALHTGYDFFLKDLPVTEGYIGAIKKTKIHKLPKLNDVITTQATILHEFMGVFMVAVQVFNSSNQEIASGEIKTVIAS